MTPTRGRNGFSARAFAAVVLWGASFVATRVALDAFHPLALIAARSWIGAFALAWLARAREGRVLPEPGDRMASAGLGLVLGVHLLIQTWGLRYTTAVNAAWIVGAMPAAIALGAHFVLGQRLAAGGWAGVALASAGVLLVTAEAPPDFENARLGDLLQVVTIATWTVYTLAAARPLRRSGAVRVNALGLAVAAVLTTLACAVPALRPGEGLVVPAELGARTLGAVFFLGVLCSAAAMALWLRALVVDGAARAAAMLYVEPFVTMAVAMTLLNEPVVPSALAGGALVLAGVWQIGRAARGGAEPFGSPSGDERAD